VISRRKQTWLLAAVLWASMFGVAAVVLGFFVSRHGLEQAAHAVHTYGPIAEKIKWILMALTIVYWDALAGRLGQLFSWTEDQIRRVQAKRWNMLCIFIFLELFLGQNILKRLFDLFGPA